MPRGIPDSWALWGARKIVRGSRRGGRGASSGGRRVAGVILSKTTSTITYSFSHLTIYDEKLRIELNTNAGQLWKWLEIKGDLAVKHAKREAGSKTGALKQSIHKKHLGNFTGQYLWIGSHNHIAYAHHQGTKPHIITSGPEGPDGKRLVFKSGAVLIHTVRVVHPGTKPNPYLSNQLRFFDRRYE
jgi:hypothetical protein